jgi:hypothetical protein
MVKDFKAQAAASAPKKDFTQGSYIKKDFAPRGGRGGGRGGGGFRGGRQ